MCRLIGVVASERTDFRFSLQEAPRSLVSLSRDNPHGWGIAIHARDAGWDIRKRAMCALEDAAFAEAACESHGEVLLAHVRLKTIGPSSLENTHPFQRGRWVFAHNGTIENLSFLRDGISKERRAEVVGDTDSELFFAYLLTRLDAANLTDRPAGALTDAAVMRAMRDALAQDPPFGACNFLLSDGETLYAHRFGRTLFALERTPGDEVVYERSSCETGAVLSTRWTASRKAVLLASEAMTDEPWEEIAEGMLLRADRRPEPIWQKLGSTLSGA